MIRKTYALLICIIFLFSCSLNNELGNAKNKYSVIFNLTANDSIQRIYFYRTAEVNDDTKTYSDSTNYFTESYGQFFIKDANVQLESNKLTYTSFDVVKDYYSTPDKGFKYINLDVLTILPDTKYSLFIEYKDENIFGTTTTPGNFEILSPSNNEIIKASDDKGKNVSFIIRWNKSYNAKGYIIKVIKTSVEYYSSTSYITADTSFFINNDMSWGNYKLEILAYDKNFHNYIIEKHYRSGLENAYGYFGSSVLKSVNFVVVY